MSGIEIIQEIEKEIGIRLKKLNFFKTSEIGFTVDSSNKIIGLSLTGCGKLELFKVIPKMTKINRLQKLSLSSNDLNDIDFIEDLDNLTHLELNNNNITDISPLSKLTRLTRLELRNNILKDLEPLSRLINLIELDLSKNNISVIYPLKELRNLVRLNMASNNISNINSLRHIGQLVEVNISDNFVVDLFPLKQIQYLKNLNLRNNEINYLNHLSEIKTLEILDISFNNVKSIEPLKNLLNLKQLYLANNYISKLASIKKMENLVILTLQGNPLKSLEKWLFEKGMEAIWEKKEKASNKEITFGKNPLAKPPVEIVKAGNEAVLRYFALVNEEGTDFIYEAKLILVGDGGAGKTSLQIRLQNPNAELPTEEERTRGIKIDHWNFLENREKPYVAHIWDFGGQDVYFPVHRFFLTENSVFVLLSSTRNERHNFDYWIPTVSQFGEKSPIILGQTCHQGNTQTWTDLGYYVGNEHFNIIKTQEKPFYKINLPEKNYGLEKLKSVIAQQIMQLPHFGQGVPASWIPLRNKLTETSDMYDCLSFDEFKKIAYKVNHERFKDLTSIKDAASFFHSIGVILWYEKIDELNDWVIMRPEWAMEAVYKIIDDDKIIQQKGHIYSDDFERIWNEECYEGRQNILKKMLEVFRIAFPKKHLKIDYIIPSRLEAMPYENKWHDSKDYLKIVYEFDLMPKGLVNQLSAELSLYISNNFEVWNNGVNLNLGTARCQIEEDVIKRKIIFKAFGKDSRALLVMATTTADVIISNYKGVVAKKIVPCCCQKCVINSDKFSFKYDDLLRWLESRSAVVCPESGVTIKIDDLLFNVGLTNHSETSGYEHKIEKRLKIFVSYSKHEENFLQDFEDHTITLKDEGLISTFNCREIEFGEEWDNKIKEKIKECDVMVCLVSVKFLNTDYIRKVEIQTAIDQNKMIIPIIVEPCDWETSALGKFQAAQRGKVVTLNNNSKLVNEIKSYNKVERAAFWTEIVKEFRRKLFT